jgi:dihydrofolate reductase
MFDDAEENLTEVDQMTDARAYIVGRNMFGPVIIRRSTPVFVLTHYPRDPQPMDGGTTYHFVTDGVESALAKAREAAGDGDVSIHGGASTIN